MVIQAMSTRRRTTSNPKATAMLVDNVPVSLRLRVKAAAKRKQLTMQEFIVNALRRAVS